MSLENDWYVAAASKDVTSKPVPAKVLGRSLVLFRGADGKVAALEDRCPHRNVALSLGQVRAGQLQCVYHGWKFDTSGACTDAPCKGPGETLTSRNVPTYPVIEREGTIWVCVGGQPLPDAPYWPEANTPRYEWFELVNRARCPMSLILENFVDCGHTGFVHPGLFRSTPKNVVRAKIEETPTGVRIETIGESEMKSVLSTLLLPKGDIQHVDEVILPHTIRVDYRVGTRHVMTVSTFTPEDDEFTRITTRIGVFFPPVSKALTPILRRLIQKIILQDVVVLESQAATIKRHGRPQFASMEADAPIVWVSRALQAYERGQYPPAELRTKEVTYTL